jgi:hypothetical protein
MPAYVGIDVHRKRSQVAVVHKRQARGRDAVLALHRPSATGAHGGAEWMA